MIKKIDAHCHLHDKRYSPDNETVIIQAIDEGVILFGNCGTTPSDWNAVIRLSAQFKQVIPFCGVHPWYIDDAGDNWEAILCDIVKMYPCGIGEIGLDRGVDWGDGEKQERFFLKQLVLAKEYNRPVSIHCRNAWDRLIALMKKSGIPGEQCMIHSFSGSAGVVRQIIDSGCYFSFSCSITNTRNKRYDEVIKNIPLERILTETDSPDIYPPVLGGVKAGLLNKPGNVGLVIQRIAEIKNLDELAVSEAVVSNYRHFLRGIV
ncbi:MAG: hypothetical protein A2015_00950 [Spirochaetes bacterium GWF1_31_7]|nr:MAG: hypothetical protein A2Y30_12810 [Spirochaetes bacterium GWE1_32_154]OHD51686.1 MAG: hypothetical protein A2Y29_04610 [Spirochaetes bacterium GWE2_31_10]OHD51939.1 MAG: hypothetical protein A2015_00950 [Spirochaetes bacterium GWF1_31_7]HBD93024.1 TatD family deoxyribonuclease [Spirochaetia bacterium]